MISPFECPWVAHLVKRQPHSVHSESYWLCKVGDLLWDSLWLERQNHQGPDEGHGDLLFMILIALLFYLQLWLGMYVYFTMCIFSLLGVRVPNHQSSVHSISTCSATVTILLVFVIPSASWWERLTSSKDSTGVDLFIPEEEAGLLGLIHCRPGGIALGTACSKRRCQKSHFFPVFSPGLSNIVLVLYCTLCGNSYWFR